MSSGLPLMKSVLIPLTKTSVMPLGITGAASATDTAIQKNLGFHDKSNSFKLSDVMKIVKSHEISDLLINGVSETVENEVKEQRGGFLGTLAATLGASLLGSVMAGREINSKIPECESTIPGIGVI